MKNVSRLSYRVRRIAPKLVIPKRCIPDFEIYGAEFTRLNFLKPSEYRYQGRVVTV